MVDDRFEISNADDPCIVIDITYDEEPCSVVDALLAEIDELRSSYNSKLNELREQYFEEISSRIELIREASRY